MAGNQSIQKYGTYDLDVAEYEQEQIDSEGGGEVLKLSAGINKLRFLPPPVDAAWAKNDKGDLTPFKITHQHFFTINGKFVAFNCPAMMKKQRCLACDEANRLRATGNQSDRELAQEMFAKRRVYANVVDRKNPEKGVRVFAFGRTIHEQLIALRKDPDVGDFTAIGADGFDITIERKGQGKMDTEYAVRPSMKTSALGNEAWLEQQHDLNRFAVLNDLETQKKKMSGDDSIEQRGGGRKAATQTVDVKRDRTAGDDGFDDTDE